MKASKTVATEEMVKPSAMALGGQTGFYQKEEDKKATKSEDQVKISRQVSESTNNQFQDAKKCTIM